MPSSRRSILVLGSRVTSWTSHKTSASSHADAAFRNGLHSMGHDFIESSSCKSDQPVNASNACVLAVRDRECQADRQSASLGTRSGSNTPAACQVTLTSSSHGRYVMPENPLAPASQRPTLPRRSRPSASSSERQPHFCRSVARSAGVRFHAPIVGGSSGPQPDEARDRTS